MQQCQDTQILRYNYVVHWDLEIDVIVSSVELIPELFYLRASEASINLNLSDKFIMDAVA